MTRIEALSILGNPLPDLAAVRAAYRKAAKKFHPDHGGYLRQMQLVNLAWELLRKIVKDKGVKGWGEWHFKKASESEPLTETIKRAYDAIKHLPGITIELCGCWLWVSGETRAVKDKLKKAGFRWNFKKKSWSFHAPGYKKRSKRQFNMDEIRILYGSTDLETDEYKAVA